MIARILRRLIPERFRPIGYLTHLVRTRTGSRVRQGPFEGMRYIAGSQGSAYIPKLLGIYERELLPVVEAIIARNPELLIDLGAAEGYYAVGLARRLPSARIVAFEMEEAGRRSLKEMAGLNEVSERLEVHGKCEPPDLAAALEGGRETVVICDVEGYEEVLLDPEKVPPLSKTPILVELHDFIVPGLREMIRDRFSATHEIALITQEPRSRMDFPWKTPVTRLLPESYLDWAVDEWRPVVMEWYWMTPKSDS